MNPNDQPIGDLSRLKEEHYQFFRQWYEAKGKPAHDRYAACKAAFVAGLDKGFKVAQDASRQATAEAMKIGYNMGREAESEQQPRRQVVLRLSTALTASISADVLRSLARLKDADVTIEIVGER